MLTSMSLVRPKLVQWRYSQRIFVTKIIKKIKNRGFWGFPIQGPILGPIFPLWAALFSLLWVAVKGLMGLKGLFSGVEELGVARPRPAS